MKLLNNILNVLAAAALTVSLSGCLEDSFKEVDELNLTRCLQPTELNAKVSSLTGVTTTFSWNVSKDAEQYNLVVYSDKELTKEVLNETIEASQVPYVVALEADASYYFSVQALSSRKEASKWATWKNDSGENRAVKTFAVKDNLYLEVSAREAASVSLSWSKDVADFKDVDRVVYGLPGADEDKLSSYTLTAADIENASASISGLTASTEYVFTLYYLSASRGQVNAWTMPDMSGLTEVNTSAALEQAIKDGANIKLAMSGSPYTINEADLGKGVDVAKGFKIYGEQDPDGTLPVINGCFSIVDSYDGGDIWFEGVELNGRNGDGGFTFQHKEGSTTDGVKVGNVTYNNCVIAGYSKGIFYEWGKTLDIASMNYENCDIHMVNGDGSGGGDGFDCRNATKVGKLNFINNTIYQSFRTFLRFDANPVIGDIRFENNTVMNLCFADNTNNGGLIAFQCVPASFSLKNNLFLHMGEKATLVSANTKYKPLGDLSLSASNNWFHNVPETFFNTNASLASAAGTMLEEDPCYNAKGGSFNLNPDSEIADKKVGASKWWTPFVEKPEDLTLNCIKGNHTWDLSNAKYFVGTMKKQMVRDEIMIVASENNPISAEDGVLTFANATVCTRKGLPTDGYLVFKVDQPGSVIVKPAAGGTAHVVVATSAVESPVSVTVKGGASELVDMGTAQKILVKDITEETLVYVYASGNIGISGLAWSTDVSPVNTALPAPAPKANPSSFTAGEATDVVISWDPVPNAGSYSAVFNGKTFPVAEGETSYTVEGKTTGMLDAGSYSVQIYANPDKNDIYNTMSEAGVASFAVLPAGGSSESSELVVKTYDELLAAIAAGKSEITLASGEYEMTEPLTVSAPLALKGQDGANVKGAFILSGEVGSFRLDKLSFTDSGAGVFITLADAGVTASEIVVENTSLDGYSKSVIYGNYDNANVDKVVFRNIETRNWGTGQGVFDFRKGTYGEIDIIGSTLVGGRDLIRLDAACVTGVVKIVNNTIDGVTLGNGNGVLYVRAEVADYTVAGNLFLNEVKEGAKTILSKATGVKVPSMRNNFYYNVDEENFFSGLITREIAIANNGTVLTSNPVRDAANYDYTLVSGLAISNRVGAPKWNPSYVDCDETSFTVKSSEEFLAALEAGKTEITLAAEGSPYTFETLAFEAVKGLHLIGEVKDGKNPEFHGFFNMSGAEDLGEVIFENIKFVGGGEQGVVLTISGTPTARAIMMKNCEVDGFTKSVIYGNGAATVQSLVFRNVTVTNMGTGQGVFDIRSGAYTNVTIEQSTITGGRDLIRADAGTITGAFNFVNNTVCGSNLGVNGNAIMYVRATPEAYKFSNNLFLNEVAEGKKVLLAKATGVTVPTVAKNNFFYNVDETNFFANLFTKEVAGAVVLSYDPCRNSTAGDYTLTDALCLSSNVGAARWNANAGRVTTEFTAANVDELLTAIEAGKTSITLKYGTYDLTAVEGNEAVVGGILSIAAPLTLKGEKKAGLGPEVIGSIKFNTGMTEFVAQGIRFNGNSLALGNLFEVASALETSKILVRDCEIYGFNKSLIYGNAEGTIGTCTFSRLLVHDMGTGQGMFDLRQKVYGSLIIENSTIYNGGRDFVRCDKGVGESITIRNNTLASTGIGAANGLLWIRSAVGEKYVVENNLFLNETGATMLAKAGAAEPIFRNNWFFNVAADKFWTGQFTQEAATANGGGVLEADPCVNSEAFNFKLTNASLAAAGVGDPRWK